MPPFNALTHIHLSVPFPDVGHGTLQVYEPIDILGLYGRNPADSTHTYVVTGMTVTSLIQH